MNTSLLKYPAFKSLATLGDRSFPCAASKLKNDRPRVLAYLLFKVSLGPTSKNLIGFTYGDFPCHVKAKRDKHVWINRLWKCKKGRKVF